MDTPALIAPFERLHTGTTALVSRPTPPPQNTPASSPLLRLPPELLERVLLAVHDHVAAHIAYDTNAHEDRAQQSNERTQHAALQEPRPSRHARLAWLAPTLTCVTLHRVALGFPPLWAAPDLALGTRWLALCLERAGAHMPLAVGARFWARGRDSAHLENDPAMAVLLQLAELFVRSAEFAVQGLSASDFRNIVLPGIQASAPHLTSLTLKAPVSRGRGEQPIVLPEAFIQHTQPTLRRIVLRGLTIVLVRASAFARVRELELECVTFCARYADLAGPAAFKSREKPNAVNLCMWLEDMPRLERLALHRPQGVHASVRDRAAPRVVSLPHLATLRIGATLRLACSLLSRLPDPTELLAYTVYRETHEMVLQNIPQPGPPLPVDSEPNGYLVDIIARAAAFYQPASGVIPLEEHFPWLSLSAEYGALQVSRPGRTLVLAMIGGFGTTMLGTLCEKFLTMCDVERIGVVVGAEQSTLAVAGRLIPSYATELSISAAGAERAALDTMFEPGDELLPALDTLRIVGAERAFFESQRLAWWLAHRARTAAPQIRTLIFQHCCVYEPAPRWAVAALERLVDEVVWIEEEHNPKVEIESELRSRVFYLNE
jgi:hypothetical protein